MTFKFDNSKEDKVELAFLRVRDAAFDAVKALWSRRKEEGATQDSLCEAMGKDRGWVSRNLAGPGNWTLRTFGSFVDAMDGHVQIVVTPIEELPRANYDIYECWKDVPRRQVVIETEQVDNGPDATVNLRVQLRGTAPALAQPLTVANAR